MPFPLLLAAGIFLASPKGKPPERMVKGAKGAGMERYDVAIIGAGPHGLIAAQVLARAGLAVLVLERGTRAGGRAVTREFLPGFKASPYADELPAIPASLFRRLGLARHGAFMRPVPATVCIAGEETSLLPTDAAHLASGRDSQVHAAVLRLRREVTRLQAGMAAWPVPPPPPPKRSWFAFRPRHPERPSWPGEDWGRESLEDVLHAFVPDPLLRLHLAAEAVSGRAASPYLAGTALHLLRGQGSGMAAGGLGGLGSALENAARAAGAAIRCEAEVTHIAIARGRANALVLASGEEIRARAILSTLDFKRTLLCLCMWNDLPGDLAKQVAQFRIMGACARVLIALEAPPRFRFAKNADVAVSSPFFGGPVHLVDSLDHLSRVHDSCRSGVVVDDPPVTLRVPSLTDPSLAPPGKAVMTVTLGAVPARPFDGAWTAEKRERLCRSALAAAEEAAPGTQARVLGCQTIVGPDMEEALGVTDGDLDGGAIAPDQVFSFRPFRDWNSGRTAIAGLYLGGHCVAPSPFLLGVAASRAAEAVIADLNAGRLR